MLTYIIIYLVFVLLGPPITSSVGNRRFREVVAQSIDDYNSAQCRAEKCGIVETIMSHVANSGGRFLKQTDGKWQELEVETVRQKIAHAIRDTTKKRDAKMKKAIQRENVANKVAHRVMASGTTAAFESAFDPTFESPSHPLAAPPIDRLVTDLNRHLQQSNAAGMLPLPSVAKDLKLAPGMGGMDLSYPTRNELRQELRQDMQPYHMGNEMRMDVGQRIRPTLGSDPRFCLSQQMDPVSSMGLGPGSQLPVGPFAGGQVMGQGLHQQPNFGLMAPGAVVSGQASAAPPPDPPGMLSQDDDFMAKIDDTLGPWQPESEPQFK